MMFRQEQVILKNPLVIQVPALYETQAVHSYNQKVCTSNEIINKE